MKQIHLFSQNARTAHGGSTRAGRRKCARPIVVRAPMHLVLRSERAVGEWSFLHRRNRLRIRRALDETAARFGVKVLSFENVGNHLHLIIQGHSRRLLQAFFKVFPQRVMFLVTGARKGMPRGKFFEGILFSRVVRWGRDLTNLRRYFGKNRIDSLGLPPDLAARLRAYRWIFAEPPSASPALARKVPTTLSLFA